MVKFWSKWGYVEGWLRNVDRVRGLLSKSENFSITPPPSHNRTHMAQAPPEGGDDKLIVRTLMLAILAMDTEAYEAPQLTSFALLCEATPLISFALLCATLIILIRALVRIQNKLDLQLGEMRLLHKEVQDLRKEAKDSGRPLPSPNGFRSPSAAPIRRCRSEHDLEVERAETVHKKFDEILEWAKTLRASKDKQGFTQVPVCPEKSGIEATFELGWVEDKYPLMHVEAKLNVSVSLLLAGMSVRENWEEYNRAFSHDGDVLVRTQVFDLHSQIVLCVRSPINP